MQGADGAVRLERGAALDDESARADWAVQDDVQTVDDGTATEQQATLREGEVSREVAVSVDHRQRARAHLSERGHVDEATGENGGVGALGDRGVEVEAHEALARIDGDDRCGVIEDESGTGGVVGVEGRDAGHGLIGGRDGVGAAERGHTEGRHIVRVAEVEVRVASLSAVRDEGHRAEASDDIGTRHHVGKVREQEAAVALDGHVRVR